MKIDRDSLHAVATAESEGVAYSIYFPIVTRAVLLSILPSLSRLYAYCQKEYGGFDNFSAEQLIDLGDLLLLQAKTEDEKKKIEGFFERVFMGVKCVSASGIAEDFASVGFSQQVKDFLKGELVFLCFVLRYYPEELLNETIKSGYFTSLGLTDYASTMATK